MQVRARHVDFGDCPPAVQRFATPGQVFVAPGTVYDVHALAVFEGITMLQVVDDLHYPAWYPGWLFEMSSSDIPVDWICSVFSDEPSVILGPPFIAKDRFAYDRMVALEPQEVDAFWARVQSRDPVRD